MGYKKFPRMGYEKFPRMGYENFLGISVDIFTGFFIKDSWEFSVHSQKYSDEFPWIFRKIVTSDAKLLPVMQYSPQNTEICIFSFFLLKE